jgi:hypothetical protein
MDERRRSHLVTEYRIRSEESQSIWKCIDLDLKVAGIRNGEKYFGEKYKRGEVFKGCLLS